ncbi:MAG TPA: type II toxin-antitoxin system Phd/YefM family antitoxin [Longimicrobiaceae bacterium]|nr:type II toxin-antitoxin system Phd/YefM family antitoxin [Longimicrobiaceae bacterium]
MSDTFNLYEAKTHLSKLVERAADGEEIIIAKSGEPKARLVPLQSVREPRKPGALKGKIWVSDDFDDPLPDGILKAFIGEEDDLEDAPDGGST